jgi:hypothetical protein
MLNVNNENSGCYFYFTQNIAERNITWTAKILLFYQTYSGGLCFIHIIFTQNTENHAINLFWQKGEFQDVDLWPAELRSAPDSIKLCNRQLGDDYTYYMSPNTNVTCICDWVTANLNPWYVNTFICICLLLCILHDVLIVFKAHALFIKFDCIKYVGSQLILIADKRPHNLNNSVLIQWNVKLGLLEISDNSKYFCSPILKGGSMS